MQTSTTNQTSPHTSWKWNAPRPLVDLGNSAELKRGAADMGKEFLDEQATVVESEELLRSVGLITSEVLSLDCDLPVAHALERLDSAGLTSAPVVDDNHVLVGMVFLRTLARLREESEFEVEDVMNTDVATVLPHSPVAEVAQLMAKHGLDRMPVVAADGHLMGVVTAMDVVRWLASRVD